LRRVPEFGKQFLILHAHKGGTFSEEFLKAYQAIGIAVFENYALEVGPTPPDKDVRDASAAMEDLFCDFGIKKAMVAMQEAVSPKVSPAEIGPQWFQVLAQATTMVRLVLMTFNHRIRKFMVAERFLDTICRVCEKLPPFQVLACLRVLRLVLIPQKICEGCDADVVQSQILHGLLTLDVCKVFANGIHRWVFFTILGPSGAEASSRNVLEAARILEVVSSMLDRVADDPRGLSELEEAGLMSTCLLISTKLCEKMPLCAAALTRSLMMINNLVRLLPRSEYVKSCLEVSKILRKVAGVSTDCVVPSIFLLQIADLRQLVAENASHHDEDESNQGFSASWLRRTPRSARVYRPHFAKSPRNHRRSMVQAATAQAHLLADIRAMRAAGAGSEESLASVVGVSKDGLIEMRLADGRFGFLKPTQLLGIKLNYPQIMCSAPDTTMAKAVQSPAKGNQATTKLPPVLPHPKTPRSRPDL